MENITDGVFKELRRQINDLKDRFEQETSQILAKIEQAEKSDTEKRNRWKPKMNEKFFAIDESGLVQYYIWKDNAFNKHGYSIGNIFRTEE